MKERSDIVDLEFLGIDRLRTSVRSDDVLGEDAFCRRMREI